MKRLIFTIILLLTPISYATAAHNQDEAYVAEFVKIAEKYSNDRTSSKCKLALQQCADKGNYYCSMWAGEIYCEEKNYIDAISNLKQCSEKCDGICDFRLGLFYHQGLGVLQSDDKAIYYYKKSVNLGYSGAAYNLSNIYVNKMFNISSVGEDAKQKSNYANLSYAWLKIAMALGHERYDSETEENLPIEKLFDARKNILAIYGSLQQGDNLATQICSKNKFCIE